MQDAPDHSPVNPFACKPVKVSEGQTNPDFRHRNRIYIHDIGGNCSSGNLPDHGSGTSECENSNPGIRSPFETEGGIRLKSMMPGRATNVFGVEPGAFQENAGRFSRYSGSDSTKHPCHAHRFGSAAYHQIAGGQGSFHVIQGREFRSLRVLAYDHLIAVDPVSIKGMKRVSQFHEDIVRNIDDVIDGT